MNDSNAERAVKVKKFSVNGRVVETKLSISLLHKM